MPAGNAVGAGLAACLPGAIASSIMRATAAAAAPGGPGRHRLQARIAKVWGLAQRGTRRPVEDSPATAFGYVFSPPGVGAPPRRPADVWLGVKYLL